MFKGHFMAVFAGKEKLINPLGYRHKGLIVDVLNLICL